MASTIDDTALDSPGLALPERTYRRQATGREPAAGWSALRRGHADRALPRGSGQNGRDPASAGRPLETMGIEVRKDRKSTRLNSSHSQISYAVFCLKKKKHTIPQTS